MKREMGATGGIAAILLLSGGALADTLHVPGEYLTIQEAIDAAVDGDVVLVADDLDPYTGDGNRDLDFGGKAITVEGNVGDPSLCVIDIGGSEGDPHRAFWFHTGEGADSIVQGFTIKKGFMDRGGAILCEAGVSPLIEDCIFDSNHARADSLGDGGGAIHVASMGGVTVQGSAFNDNHMEDVYPEGELEGGGAINGQEGSSLTLIGCTFTGNSAASETGAWGGAIDNIGGSVTMEGCVLTGNTSVYAGAFDSWMSTVSQTGCTYTGNSSQFAGAVLNSDTVSTYVDCTFEGNSTIYTGDGNAGGAYVGNLGADVTMTGCVFMDNTAAANVAGGAGFNNATVKLDGCTFIGNEVVSGNGGGLTVNNGSTASLNACRFEQNMASSKGGAVEIGYNFTEATIVNSLLVSNEAGLGGGVAITGTGHATLVNTTIEDNVADFGGGGLVVTDANGQGATIVNSILWGDAPNEILDPFGLVTVSYSDVEGGWAGTGNVDCDPLFVDPDNGDYHILADCVTNAGDDDAVPEGIDTDLDGNPRFVGVVDLGAYERQCPADCDGNGALNILDFVCYQQLFQAGDPGADCNADGELSVLDFVCFQGLFQAGCP